MKHVRLIATAARPRNGPGPEAADGCRRRGMMQLHHQPAPSAPSAHRACSHNHCHIATSWRPLLMRGQQMRLGHAGPGLHQQHACTRPLRAAAREPEGDNAVPSSPQPVVSTPPPASPKHITTRSATASSSAASLSSSEWAASPSGQGVTSSAVPPSAWGRVWLGLGLLPIVLWALCW